MKKVLFLSPLPPPHYGSALSSKMCLNILENSKEFEVKKIQLNYSKDMKDIGRINFDKIKGIFRVKREIKKILKEFNPDVIYMVPATSYQGVFRDYFFVREIRKNWKGKILFHIRSRITGKDWKNPLRRDVLKKLLKNQKAIVLGKELVSDLHNLIKNENIIILPNAIKNEVSENELKKIIQSRGENKKFQILFLSNMDREKGWKKILQSCKILNEKDFEFECNFVGEWKSQKDKEYFEDFVLKNKLKYKVFAVGKKTGKEKNKFLEKANVLVFPTEYKLETFGRVILEGMMYGLPIIANSVATIPSTIQKEKTGFLLKKNTPEEIASLLMKKNNWDKMGLEGRKRFLKEFELERYGRKFLRIFRKI